MLKILIQPLGVIEENTVKAVKDFLSDVFKASVEVSARNISIPSRLYNAGRKQYNSDGVIKWLRSEINFKDGFVVGLADVDAYVNGLNFIFGEATPTYRICIVYLVRLRQSFYSLTDNFEVFIERVRKEVLHEVGHLLYLQHCINPKCVMKFSNSIYDTDFKKAMLCPKCSEQLLHYGVSVSPQYILQKLDKKLD
jgi:archaemetzincin